LAVAQIKQSPALWSVQVEALSWVVSWVVSSVVGKERLSVLELVRLVALQQLHPNQLHPRKLHPATHNFQTFEWSESDCILLALLGDCLFAFPH
jgi:hypothetical protein